MKKLALFDIDGVIYGGHAVFDLVQDQERRGFVAPGLWKKIEGELDKYKNGEKNYKEAADSMLSYYAEWLKGKKYADLLKDNLDFIKTNEEKVFPYFKDLVAEISTAYDIYFITTNFDCTAEAFMRKFGVKSFLSSRLALKDGIVTGKVELSLGGNKGIVSDLISQHDWRGSIAVGDSENDADMLNKVEYPLVMEPNEKLEAISIQEGWQIVNRNTITDIIMSQCLKK